MMDFLTWLEQLPFSMWVLQSGSVWAYPSILTAHTIGMTVVAGLVGVDRYADYRHFSHHSDHAA